MFILFLKGRREKKVFFFCLMNVLVNGHFFDFLNAIKASARNTIGGVDHLNAYKGNSDLMKKKLHPHENHGQDAGTET